MDKQPENKTLKQLQADAAELAQYRALDRAGRLVIFDDDLQLRIFHQSRNLCRIQGKVGLRMNMGR